jgi:hypothetical protein
MTPQPSCAARTPVRVAAVPTDAEARNSETRNHSFVLKIDRVGIAGGNSFQRSG